MTNIFQINKLNFNLTKQSCFCSTTYSLISMHFYYSGWNNIPLETYSRFIIKLDCIKEWEKNVFSIESNFFYSTILRPYRTIQQLPIAMFEYPCLFEIHTCLTLCYWAPINLPNALNIPKTFWIILYQHWSIPERFHLQRTI